MKILVTAQQLRLDETSEGICSSKFLALLASAGHEVVCLTADRLDRNGAGRPLCSWLPAAVTVRHLDEFTAGGPWTRTSALSRSVAERGAAGAWLDRKVNALVAYSTGYQSHVWRQVEGWRRGIQHLAAEAHPDAIVVRSAGSQFEPHLAMSRLRLGVPWIANYHDPFPVSLYPEPYRAETPILSSLQERLHRRIVRTADALTFPSERLSRWVLKGDLAEHRQKAFVVPHLAGGLDESRVAPAGSTPDDNVFTIVHTGSLLNQRDPRALLKGFLDFLQQDPARRGRARLVFVGWIHRIHSTHPEWAPLVDAGAVVRLEHRVPYSDALAISQNAAAVVVLEAACAESPFFPAKLADYLWLKRPILALSPRESSTADILGADYRFLVAPDDVPGITASLSALWDAWSRGQLSGCLPPVDVAAAFGPDAVRAQFERVLAFALHRQLAASAKVGATSHRATA